ncbi:S-adenosylmethionine:tRNA ribosyltransferase-isomerase [Candidatus Peribacteria bacterium]|nr:S-adenosylmethionine:tRNA ribosyltransferase-isomerase [Candidatus Peribacteria bacterium]
METKLFDYDLPDQKIAQYPLEPRDSSRLLVCENPLREIVFRDITSFLQADDILVINDTRVMPARITGYTILHNGTKKDVECLFLRNTSPDIWEIMCFP